MKRLLVVLTALLLASCIDVKDFGTYWAKTSIDPNIGGNWLRLRTPEEENKPDFPVGQRWHFVEKNGAYEIRTHTDGKEDEEPAYPVKTLIVGPYRFLAFGPQKGEVVRYEITKDVFTWYVLDFQAAGDFIDKNYPRSQNIKREESGCHPAEAYECPVKIKSFDEEVYKILSAIPDNETYWRPYFKLEKIRN